MNDMFEEFIKKLSEEIKRELPGFSAQKQMAPLGRKPPLEYLKKGAVPKKSAVLILLYPESGTIKTVLILRPENEGGNHAGQISFPGGGIHESDKDLAETALREAEEEIGVNRSTIRLIGELTSLYIPVSNYVVHPFVGVTTDIPEFKIEPMEVQGLLLIGMNDLMSDNNQKQVEKYIKLKDATMQVPCYEINGKVIWGATAMIIAEFAEIMKRIG